MIALLNSSESDITEEAGHVILEITSHSTITQLERLINKGDCIPPLLDLFARKTDENIITVATHALSNILHTVGETDYSETGQPNRILDSFVKAGSPNKIFSFMQHRIKIFEREEGIEALRKKLVELRVPIEELADLEEAEAARQTAAKQRVARLTGFDFTLQNKHRDIVNALSNDGSDNDVISNFVTDNGVISNVVTRLSMRRLQPEGWLNDEIVNGMFFLLSERDRLKNKVRSHFFSTSFATKLLNKKGTSDGEYEYDGVKSWSLKVPGGDIFECDKVFIPINVHKNHWILAVIFVKKQRIEIFDSLNGDVGYKYLLGIFRYLEDDYLDKRGTHLPNSKDWNLVLNASKPPRQTNGTIITILLFVFGLVFSFFSSSRPLVLSHTILIIMLHSHTNNYSFLQLQVMTVVYSYFFLPTFCRWIYHRYSIKRILVNLENLLLSLLSIKSLLRESIKTNITDVHIYIYIYIYNIYF